MAKAYLEVDYLSGDETRTARTSVGSCSGLDDDLTLSHDRVPVFSLRESLEFGNPPESFVDVYEFNGDLISPDEFARLKNIIIAQQVAGSYCDGC